MSIVPGQTLGSFIVENRLGAGGMGEVYRARDLKLERDVAIKLLPDDFAHSATWLARFEREARSLAALTHPHIATIHGFEEVEGTHFLVLELVTGQTLEKRLRWGRLRLREALHLAVQISRALGAAHECGIIHRDLKPSNIIVTPAGDAKLVDFGLAKLIDSAASSDADKPTAPVDGIVYATPSYMSPELASGEEPDHRSDVWSFGCVLFELLTGTRAFHEPTRPGTIMAVLTREPTWEALPPGTPATLRPLLQRCLEKQRAQRPSSMNDVALWIDAARSEATPTSPGVGPARRQVAVNVAIGLASAALASLLTWWALQPGQDPPVGIVPFTTDGGWKAAPQLSPDGERVAYEWGGPLGDNWDVYVKAMGLGSVPFRLTRHQAADVGPVWSPDGRSIAFVREPTPAMVSEHDAGAAIYTVPSFGGNERKLVAIEGQVWAYGNAYFIPSLAWAPDGRWLAFAESAAEDEPARLVRLSLATLEKEPLTSPPEGSVGDLYPSFSPDGRKLAFVRAGTLEGNQDVWVLSLDRGTVEQLTFESYQTCHSLAWTDSSSEVVYRATSEGRLFRVDASGGAPQPVSGVGLDALSVTVRAGHMVYAQATAPPWEIWKTLIPKGPSDETAPERLISSSQPEADPAYSPDGSRIAFQSGRTGVGNVWVADSDGSNLIQVTNSKRLTGGARWAPDGERLVVHSLENGNWDIFTVPVSGGSLRPLTQGPAEEMRGSWSRDGRYVYYSSKQGGPRQLWKVPERGGEPVQVTHNGGVYGEESWDGRFLYYVTSETDSGIWRVNVDGDESTQLEIVRGPIYWSDWTVVEEGIYFTRTVDRSGGQEFTLFRFDVASGTIERLLSRRGAFSHRWLTVSPREDSILFGESPDWQSELMLVENFR